MYSRSFRCLVSAMRSTVGLLLPAFFPKNDAPCCCFCFVLSLPELIGPYVCTPLATRLPSGGLLIGRLFPFDRLLLDALLAVLGFRESIPLNKYYV
jgi:hypothetical protein